MRVAAAARRHSGGVRETRREATPTPPAGAATRFGHAVYPCICALCAHAHSCASDAYISPARRSTKERAAPHVAVAVTVTEGSHHPTYKYPGCSVGTYVGPTQPT
eukprot:scaffold1236_cov116-Isochrysis_galbana.AAC.8